MEGIPNRRQPADRSNCAHFQTKSRAHNLGLMSILLDRGTIDASKRSRVHSSAFSIPPLPACSMSDTEAGPSSQGSQPARSATADARHQIVAAQSSRPRMERGRHSSSLSTRSDSTTISSGVHRRSWSTGDSYDYVDEDKRISAFLQCPICLGPFLNPYVSDGCSHTFCKRCITLALTLNRSDDVEEDSAHSASRCPTCRSKVQLDHFKPTALLIKNMVDTLRVSCPNKNLGCSHTCERHLLRSHIARECEFEYIDQITKQGKRCGCSEKVMRKDWVDHGFHCPKRKVQCSTCDASIPFDQLDDHCKTCSPEPIWCDYCKLETIQSRLPIHVSECSFAPVPCIYAAYGCSWTGPRCQLQTSEATADSHLDHCRLEPLKEFLTIFAQQSADLKNDNASLRRRLDELESRQRSQSRRTDDVMHSIGSWYRSAGEAATLINQETRGSQVGVDGEWDEFPLDAQNWERSLSQTNYGSMRRPTRSQSASAASAPDHNEWIERPPNERQRPPLGDRRLDASYFAPMLEDVEPSSDSRSLLSEGSRSMPSSSQIEMASAIPLRTRDTGSAHHQTSDFSFGHHRRSVTASAGLSPARDPFEAIPAGDTFATVSVQYAADGMDRTNLDSALTSLGTSLRSLTVNLSNLDKRSEDSHVTAVKASFESARAQEEVQSLRHGLHAIRVQIHQMLMMQQQRYAMLNAPSPATASASGSMSLSTSALEHGMPAQPYQSRPNMRDANIPLRTPPLLMRRWGGFDQTKL